MQVDMLFKLLDKEVEENLPRLLGALGALRNAYERNGKNKIK
jgi:hypothetical protein